jgi:hypothetical protein
MNDPSVRVASGDQATSLLQNNYIEEEAGVDIQKQEYEAE